MTCDLGIFKVGLHQVAKGRPKMSDISFRKVDIDESENMSRAVFELVSKELSGEQPTELIKRVIDYQHGAVVLGGFVGDELVCINAFMPTTFSDGAKSYVGYQSGYSATRSDHRGKGYWPKLLLASEGILADMGGSFIFGFPNELSHPLFVKKLGYTTLRTAKTRIVLFPGAYNSAFRKSNEEKKLGILRPDIRSHIAWKRRSSDAPLVVFEEKGSIIWGKTRNTKKAGVPIKFLEIGSMEIAPGGDLKALTRKVASLAGVRFCYVTVNHDNEFAPLLKPQGEGQPIIFKAFKQFNERLADINFFGGLMDTY